MSNRTRGRPKGGWIDDRERRPAVVRIRARHHVIAKLFACGQTRNQVADLVGMSPERVGQLSNDPTFQDLIAQYRRDPDVVRAQGIDAIAFQREQMVALNQGYMNQAQQHLDEAEESGDTIALRDSLRAIEIFSDRIGLGRHSTQTHVYDFATELENRRNARMKTIEAKASPNQAQQPLLLEGAGSDSLAPSTNRLGDGEGRDQSTASVPPLRRRAL